MQSGYGEMHVRESRLTCIAKKRVGLVRGGYQGLHRESNTSRKLIYDFLLVINTNLPPILHRFQCYGQIFASQRGMSHFSALARVYPCQYRRVIYH